MHPPTLRRCANRHRSFALLALAILTAAPASAWETFPDDQDPSSLYYIGGPAYPWVHFDSRYGQPGWSQYKGVWRQPNSWPTSGDSVNIRHQVNLQNTRYYTTGGPTDPGIVPFPATLGGYLEVNSLNLEPGGAVFSSLEIFSFDGASVWNGGFVSAGNYSNSDGSGGGRGRLRNKGTVTVTGGSTIGRVGEFYNTNRILVESSLNLEFGHYGLYNESGILPDASWAEIELRGDGRTITMGGGGGGAPVIHNYGVLRKSGPGTSSILIPVVNYTDSSRNRSGTVQVDQGTLVIDSGGMLWNGLKAEVAPGAVLSLRGNHRFDNGTTTVTGGGVLRFDPGPDQSIYAGPGTLPEFAAPEGKLECAGADLRDLMNTGSLNVTAPSIWRGVINKGHVRQFAGLTLSYPSSNGTATATSAVWDLEDTAGFRALNIPPVFHNYALLRKVGPGTSVLADTGVHIYGSDTDPLAGRIEVAAGTLRWPAAATFHHGGRIRVANGTTLEIAHSVFWEDNGTLHFTGSGKVRLLPGSIFYAGNAASVGTVNAAPGTWEFNGGQVAGPCTNIGEITVTAPTLWSYGFLGSNTVTNSGTLHFLATSAGTGNSMALSALVGMDCTPTSVLAFDIAGRPHQNDQWARLRFGGQNYWGIGGKLRINFGDFTPVSGDRWEVINYSSGFNPPTGDFASVEFANVPAGFVPVSEKLGTGSYISYRVGLDAAPAPVSYASWTAAQSFPTPAAGDFDTDADGDGYSNGVECALGTNPQSPAATPPVQAVRQDSGGDVFLTAQFRRPAAGNRPTDIAFIGERTDTLGSWTTQGVLLEFGPVDPQGHESVIVRAAEPMTHAHRTFLRLRVHKTP